MDVQMFRIVTSCKREPRIVTFTNDSGQQVTEPRMVHGKIAVAACWHHDPELAKGQHGQERIEIDWNPDLGILENHTEAARLWAITKGWSGDWQNVGEWNEGWVFYPCAPIAFTSV
jgi:hypothetical protein